MNQYRHAFSVQRSNARRRGIAFRLSFEQWVEFWGEDIHRRGTGPNDLQMQRFHDEGAYEIGNIKKGTPRENAITAEHCRQREVGLRLAAEHQVALDRLMFEESDLHEPEDEEDDGFPKLGIHSSYSRRFSFVGDYNR
jgi:hypothetical protein